jgi:hypothetical protein
MFPVLYILSAIFFGTGGVPHFEDEIAYLYQARALSSFQYPGVTHDVFYENSMQSDFVLKNDVGKMVGIYPVLFPLYLSFFARFSFESIGLFLLAVINLFLTQMFLGQYFSKRRLAPWLLLGSSFWFIFYSSFYFSQNLSLFFTLILLIRLKHERVGWVDYLVCGLSYLARPADGIIHFVFILLRTLFSRQWKSLCWVVLFFTGVGINSYHNYIVMGYKWGIHPYKLVYPPIGYGFSSTVGMEQSFGFNIWQALKNFMLVLLSANETLFGWAQLSLLPLIIFAVLLVKRKFRFERRLQECFLLMFLWLGFYFCFFFPGLVVAPRFQFPLLPIFILFSAKAITHCTGMRLPVLVFSLISMAYSVNFLFLDGDTRTSSQEIKTIEVFKNGVGILSDINKLHSFEEDKVYVIPDIKYLYKPLYQSFYHYNDFFNKRIRFIHSKDFVKHPEFFKKQFGKNLVIMGHREQ